MTNVTTIEIKPEWFDEKGMLTNIPKHELFTDDSPKTYVGMYRAIATKAHPRKVLGLCPHCVYVDRTYSDLDAFKYVLITKTKTIQKDVFCLNPGNNVPFEQLSNNKTAMHMSRSMLIDIDIVIEPLRICVRINDGLSRSNPGKMEELERYRSYYDSDQKIHWVKVTSCFGPVPMNTFGLMSTNMFDIGRDLLRYSNWLLNHVPINRDEKCIVGRYTFDQVSAAIKKSVQVKAYFKATPTLLLTLVNTLGGMINKMQGMDYQLLSNDASERAAVRKVTVEDVTKAVDYCIQTYVVMLTDMDLLTHNEFLGIFMDIFDTMRPNDGR